MVESVYRTTNIEQPSNLETMVESVYSTTNIKQLSNIETMVESVYRTTKTKSFVPSFHSTMVLIY